MIGALKCPAAGVRMLRTVTPSSSSGGVSASSLESYGTFGRDRNCNSMNWSQKRFLRCLPTSSFGGTGNINAQFTVNEIENQHKRLAETSAYGNHVRNLKKSLSKENYSRSITGHQSYLLTSLDDPMSKRNLDDQLVAELYKIVIENGHPTVRVKSNKDDILVKEWIGIQNELQVIKRDRIEEDKRRLQIAGQQVLREMEASLRKGMNLEDLDEAIEGALCSELKDQ